MQLGVFAKTFERDTLEANLDAVRESGFQCTQYNLDCAGLPTLPDEVSPELCQQIRNAHADRGLTMAALSGTFNIIHDDRDELEANFRRLEILAQACAALGTDVITLCTGTRDQRYMWRAHPDNGTAAAWQDVVASMRRIADIAEANDVYVGIEPEVNNVVDTAEKALDQDVLPGTISSDVHQWNVNGPVFDLATTLSKFMHLGLTIEQVIERATKNPSMIHGQLNGLGTLKVGGEADAAVFSLDEGDFVFTDAPGATRIGHQLLRPVATVKGGHLYGMASVPVTRL